MVLRFVGTAHPPDSGKRSHPADYDHAEIITTNLGHRGRHGGSTPILIEHEGDPVGYVLSSYRGIKNSLRVLGVIDDEHAEELVRSGKMLGLSLSTDVIHREGEEDKPLLRTVTELSICEEPRRPGCYISEVDGERYHTATMAASNSDGVCVYLYFYRPVAIQTHLGWNGQPLAYKAKLFANVS